VINKLGEDI